MDVDFRSLFFAHATESIDKDARSDRKTRTGTVAKSDKRERVFYRAGNILLIAEKKEASTGQQKKATQKKGKVVDGSHYVLGSAPRCSLV